MALVWKSFMCTICVILAGLNFVKCNLNFATIADVEWVECPTGNFTEVPEFCLCRNSSIIQDDLTILCRKSAHLYTIPDKLPSNLKHLKLEDQFFLEEIRPLAFGPYNDLITLVINDCDLRLIHASAFMNLTNLVTLDLSRNQLGSSSLTNNSFVGLSSLKTLVLDNNDLYKLEANVIHGTFMPHVQNISMRMCKMEDFVENAITSVGQLARLDLSQNRLKRIPKLGGCEKHSFLEFTYFNLSHNQIDILEGFHCNEMKVLKVIDLSYNQFDFLGDKSLEHGDDNVVELYLQFNKVNQIQLDAFKRSKKTLKILDVRNNSLRTLHQHGLNANGMTQILVSGNKWHCDCDISWFNMVLAVREHNSNKSLLCDTPTSVRNTSIAGNTVFDECGPAHISVSKAVGIVIAVLISIIAVVALAYFLFRYSKTRKQEPRDPSESRSHPVGSYKRMQNSTLFAFDYDDRDRDMPVQGNSSRQQAQHRDAQTSNNNRQQPQQPEQKQPTTRPRDREMATWKTTSDTAVLTNKRDDPGVGPFTIE